MKRSTGFNYSFLLLLSLSLLLVSCSESPEKVLDKYRTAFNSHNTGELLSLFDKNAVIELSFNDKLKGRDQIWDYARYDSVLNAKIKISDIAESDDKTMFVLYRTSDLLKTAGIDTAKYSMIFEINRGKIKHISGTTTPGTDKKIEAYRNPFMLWAAKERLDLLNKIMPEGKFVYNAVNAERLLRAVMDWKRSDPVIKSYRDK